VQGQPEALATQDFYDACRAMLHPDCWSSIWTATRTPANPCWPAWSTASYGGVKSLLSDGASNRIALAATPRILWDSPAATVGAGSRRCLQGGWTARGHGSGPRCQVTIDGALVARLPASGLGSAALPGAVWLAPPQVSGGWPKNRRKYWGARRFDDLHATVIDFRLQPHPSFTP
jgi:hypothetical protein